jgi:hypothetical protein
MQRFQITVYKPADMFYIGESKEVAYSEIRSGYNALRKFIRERTPKGIRVRSSRWFSKWLRGQCELELKHPLFDTLMFAIKKINK